ncbi:MAG: alpha/beta fold hydrolase [Terrimicrobiaceae bacterium]
MRKRQKQWTLGRALLIASVWGVGALLAVVCLPMARRPFANETAGKPPSYAEAVGEIRKLIAGTSSKIRPQCAIQLLDHGHPTEQVFVLLHGLSNCPAQFTKLGRLLFERGHNVVIPLVPYHGEENRLATDWGRLSAEDMLEAGNQAVDLARGLGTKVTAAGLSISGATVAWMAQNRSDVSRAVLLAPFLAPAGIPRWAWTPLERLLLRLPNMFFWWDSTKRENLEGPPYAYPRFPTRVIGETMLLGRRVLEESRSQAPRCPSILVVTTASDTAANNGMTAELVANWRGLRREGIETFEFAAADEVPHDFVDPNQPNQKTALVYPKLIELLEE